MWTSPATVAMLAKLTVFSAGLLLIVKLPVMLTSLGKRTASSAGLLLISERPVKVSSSGKQMHVVASGMVPRLDKTVPFRM